MNKLLLKTLTVISIMLFLACPQNVDETPREDDANFKSFYEVDDNGHFKENIKLKVNNDVYKAIHSITSLEPYVEEFDNITTFNSDGSFSYVIPTGFEEENGIRTYQIDYIKGTYVFNYATNYITRTITQIKTSYDQDYITLTTPSYSNSYVAIFENHILDSFNYENSIATMHVDGISFLKDDSYISQNEVSMNGEQESIFEMLGIITLNDTNLIMNSDVFINTVDSRVKFSSYYKDINITGEKGTYNSALGELKIYNGTNNESYALDLDDNKSDYPMSRNNVYYICILKTDSFIYTRILEPIIP